MHVFRFLLALVLVSMPAWLAAQEPTDQKATLRERILKQLDKDGDGKLSPSERTAARAAFFPDTIAPQEMNWTVGDLKREALVYLPSKPSQQGAPIIFGFHGHGGSSRNAARSFGFERIWPEALVVYMQGVPTPGRLTDPEGKRNGWQHDVGEQDDRDLKFFDAVLATLREKYQVDDRRIYATGHSNGGGFTYLLWAKRPDVFAAVAPSAASSRRLRQLTPMPAMHIAGRNDKLVLFSWQEQAIEAVKRINGCRENGSEWAKDCTQFASDKGTPFIAFIHDGTHQYPSEAPRLIVRFCQEHARSPMSDSVVVADHARPFPLWHATQPLPLAADIHPLPGVTFHVIKKWDQKGDGYTFLHGVGLGWHRGKLYASIGHNKGAENTVTEEAQYRVSDDQGQTWSELRVIDAGEEDNLAVSHGVFHSWEGKLWAFHGAYHNKMEHIHTRAYTLNEATGEWTKHGVVIRQGFWPMNQPVKMDDGNWIMPGFSAGPYSSDRVFPAAVAISHGNDFTKWDYVEISTAEDIKRMWGESSLWVDGKRVFNIARYGGGASALVAISEDYGRTWSPSRISNLPMATSKPAAGTLSTGQRFLICTTAKNNGGQRTPLTIAVTRPGEHVLEKVFVIRRSQHPDQPGESAERLSLSYPCAIEHDGHLFVGYSNNGGRRGNLNSAELAVIPIKNLETD